MFTKPEKCVHEHVYPVYPSTNCTCASQSKKDFELTIDTIEFNWLKIRLNIRNKSYDLYNIQDLNII